VNHLLTHGYEGIEQSAEYMTMFFPGDTHATIARKVERRFTPLNLRVFGSFVWVRDADFERMTPSQWREHQLNQLKLVVDIGGQYANCNYLLPAAHQNTGGDYRADERFLDRAAGLIREMRDMAFDLGLNFYVEVHNNYITEGPRRVLPHPRPHRRRADGRPVALPLPGHHARRALGPHLPQRRPRPRRLSRLYGDLSASVDDPKADWEQKGLTWQLFQITKPALSGGLSSRVVIGETGPMHLVKDGLALDVKLIPLCRAMAGTPTRRRRESR